MTHSAGLSDKLQEIWIEAIKTYLRRAMGYRYLDLVLLISVALCFGVLLAVSAQVS